MSSEAACCTCGVVVLLALGMTAIVSSVQMGDASILQDRVDSKLTGAQLSLADANLTLTTLRANIELAQQLLPAAICAAQNLGPFSLMVNATLQRLLNATVDPVDTIKHLWGTQPSPHAINWASEAAAPSVDGVLNTESCRKTLITNTLYNGIINISQAMAVLFHMDCGLFSQRLQLALSNRSYAESAPQPVPGTGDCLVSKKWETHFELTYTGQGDTVRVVGDLPAEGSTSLQAIHQALSATKSFLQNALVKIQGVSSQYYSKVAKKANATLVSSLSVFNATQANVTNLEAEVNALQDQHDQYAGEVNAYRNTAIGTGVTAAVFAVAACVACVSSS